MAKKPTKAPVGAILSIQVIGWSMLATHLVFIWLSTRYSFFPGYEALMNVVGTMAEIIAGLYGITMASYTFFLSRIDSLCAQDVTMDYIAASLKRRFKLLIWFISGNVLWVLFTCLFLMYFPELTQANHAFVYRLFCNEFVLSLVYAIGLILYYAILVIDPNCLEKEAKKLKHRLSPGHKGDPVEFIDLYDCIEAACSDYIPQPVLDRLHASKGCRFSYTLALLPRVAPELRPLMPSLRRLHRYYECVVNCRTLTVSREMCALARRILKEL